MCGFCNVWVCLCVGFVMCGCVYVCVCMCGCFGNVYLYLMCFVLFVLCFVFFHLCIFIIIFYKCKDYCHRVKTQFK